jgi:hypothetical protein
MYLPIQILAYRYLLVRIITLRIEQLLRESQQSLSTTYICIEKALLLNLAMDSAALPTFQNLPAHLREPFLRAVLLGGNQELDSTIWCLSARSSKMERRSKRRGHWT